MKRDCSIIYDLLPLYLEKMVSDDTNLYIIEHLKNCPECTAKLDYLSNSTEIEHSQKYEEKRPNADVEALRNIKKKIKRKKNIAVFLSIAITIIIILICIRLWPASINYGSSTMYSKQDMDEAIQLIEDEFYSWKGCKLYSISYTDDILCQHELDYCNSLSDGTVIYEECIVFRTHFRSPIFNAGAWNPNQEYDWSWFLARTTDGEWELLTWGAP